VEVDTCLRVVRSAEVRKRATSAADVADESADKTFGRRGGSAQAANESLAQRGRNPQFCIPSGFHGSSSLVSR